MCAMFCLVQIIRIDIWTRQNIAHIFDYALKKNIFILFERMYEHVHIGLFCSPDIYNRYGLLDLKQSSNPSKPMCTCSCILSNIKKCLNVENVHNVLPNPNHRHLYCKLLFCVLTSSRQAIIFNTTLSSFKPPRWPCG